MLCMVHIISVVLFFRYQRICPYFAVVLCTKFGLKLSKLHLQHIFLGVINLQFVFAVYDTCVKWLYYLLIVNCIF